MFSPEPFGENTALPKSLTSDFLLPEPGENASLLLSATGLVLICLGTPKTNKRLHLTGLL